LVLNAKPAIFSYIMARTSYFGCKDGEFHFVLEHLVRFL